VARYPALKLNKRSRTGRKTGYGSHRVLETIANGELRMRFDRLTVTVLRLIRLAEAEILRRRPSLQRQPRSRWILR
jgi:hypothetical protein